MACVLAALALPDAAALVSELAADTHRERNDAADRLLEMGDAALPALRNGAVSHEPAIRERAGAILELLTSSTGPGSAARKREAAATVRLARLAPGGLEPGSGLDRRLAALGEDAGNELAAAARRAGPTIFAPEALVLALARHVTPKGIEVLAELLREERLLPSTTVRAARELEARAGAAELQDALRLARRDAAQAVRHHLADGPGPLRRAAVALFAALAGSDGVDALADRARDGSAPVRAEVARALGRYAPGSYHSLLGRMADDVDAHVRHAALVALERYPSAPDPAVVARTVSDPAPSVRVATARLLGRASTHANLRELRRMAADPSLRVRLAARQSLRRLEARDR